MHSFIHFCMHSLVRFWVHSTIICRLQPSLGKAAAFQQSRGVLELPSGIVGQVGALLCEPVLSDHAAPLLHFIPLLCVALDDICHAVPAECHYIAQLLAPSCLHTRTQFIGHVVASAKAHASLEPSPFLLLPPLTMICTNIALMLQRVSPWQECSTQSHNT